MTPGDVHRHSGIFLTTEENPNKPRLGDVSHRLKWDPIHPNEVGRIAHNIRKGKEGNKETIM